MAELNSQREAVRERYAAAARLAAEQASQAPTGCCAPAHLSASPADQAGLFGATLYRGTDDDDVPRQAINASLGCGVPTAVADLQQGETVLDLGSGAVPTC